MKRRSDRSRSIGDIEVAVADGGSSQSSMELDQLARLVGCSALEGGFNLGDEQSSRFQKASARGLDGSLH